MPRPAPRSAPATPAVTLKDIAARAGVSVMTASRVLADKGHVSAEKRRIVREIASQLGYLPNPMVQRIMSEIRRGRLNACIGTLGWLNTHASRREWRDIPYRRHFYEGAIERAEQLGLHVDEVWAGEPGMTPVRLTQILISRGIEGLIIPPQAESAFLTGMDLGRFAVGFISPPRVPGRWNWAESDNLLAISLACDAVRSAGRRRPGLVLARLHDQPGQGWRAGFLASQDDAPVRSRVPILRLPGSLEEHPKLYQAWLKKHCPDVVIGCDYRLKPFAEDAGFSVPDQLALVHLHLAEDVEGWAGVDPLDLQVGHAATELVASSLRRNERGEPASPVRVLVPGVWRDGVTLPPRH